jgi:ribonuclease E
MAIRQRGEVTQIAVLEDNVLVEHYVALESQSSIIGNVYLGRVQNVLPSMEAAFIDIGKGRNAVLYAGEVNWDLRDDKNQPRRIENALKPGQSVLVQVSKDPIGHKGARLTSQISLPGRYLVYVPGGGTSGISRKLPDTERNRLKNLLKDILPEAAGVIIRTAAEGASEDELTRDVTRLTARWEDIEKKSTNGQAPQLLYAEPDTTLKVVRDLFTEDFSKLVISGDDAWDMVDGYVQHVAPDLTERLERYDGDKDVFASFRIDEQISKALERKVWLPSGGSLVIDRTEAMTVVDVNTGKFTGSGGNLEETVTKNNLEAAEEIVRQLRLRDIGGIIVVDFIDMVLENNRDLVLRRLVECLGRDRTRHQVAEVTSLGLVQMTRKRISTGLLEAFSHSCEHCQGRGVIIEGEPVDPKKHEDHQQGTNGTRGGARRSTGRRRGRRGGGEADGDALEGTDATDEAIGSGDSSADASGDSPDTAATDDLTKSGPSKRSSGRKRSSKKPDDESPGEGGDAARTASREPTDAADKSDGGQQAAPETATTPEPSTEPSAEPAGRSLRSEPDELPSATTPRGRRRRRASRPSGAPTRTS